jgi:hypothetical protein
MDFACVLPLGGSYRQGIREVAMTEQDQDDVRAALTEMLTNVPQDVEEVLGPFLHWCRDHIDEIEALAFLELVKESVSRPR